MQADVVFRRHIGEHATQPVVCQCGKQVGLDAKLGAAKGRCHRVSAKRDGIVLCDVFFVSHRHMVGKKSDIDIALADEERLHCSARYPGSPMPQISLAYSRMARSDEKKPMRAVLRMLAFHQAGGSRHSQSTWR